MNGCGLPSEEEPVTTERLTKRRPRVNPRAARIARPAVFTLVLGVCLLALVGCGGGVSDAEENPRVGTAAGRRG